MKRLALPVLFVLGLALAGGMSATVVASTTGSTSTGTTTSPTTTVPTTTPAPDVIPPGVTIGGVPVGTLSSDEAYAAVQQAFSRPLPLLVAGHRLAPLPAQFGAVARIKAAVEKAKTALPGADVPLVVTVARPEDPRVRRARSRSASSASPSTPRSRCGSSGRGSRRRCRA